MQIQGTIALVTGADRGIGKAFAVALLERGAAKVYAGVRDVATVSDVYPRLVPVQLDVTDTDRVAAVARDLDDVQLVVNNAGIARPATPLSAELNAARAELEVNCLSLIATTQAFAPTLAANGGGAFVNVPIRRVMDRQPNPVNLHRVEIRRLELHQLGTRRAQTPGHPRRRRPRRLRRHQPHRRTRPRQDRARRRGARCRRSRRARSDRRRAQPPSQGQPL
ncbi:MAG: SDR family NAD(P)-dependent oxidoreductase [Solirubrobacterales bacterium]|nr:SDR family NAD(P)-dependent oxidoreductase [Solirubrobacterales bacterium]